MMKEYSYTVSTNTIWVNFDFGTVRAENEKQAFELAEAEIERDLQKANELLGNEFEIGIDTSQIQITEKK